MAQLPRASSMHALAAAHVTHSKKVTMNTPKKKKLENNKDNTVTSPTVSLLQDCLPSYGLFEASQIACPVLPQYHPQQLMELLNSGDYYILFKKSIIYNEFSLTIIFFYIKNIRKNPLGKSHLGPFGAVHFRPPWSR